MDETTIRPPVGQGIAVWGAGENKHGRVVCASDNSKRTGLP